MIFEALVLDTDRFFETGKITVRIPEFYFGEMEWDISEDPETAKNLYEDNVAKDFEVFVYSPYGGGKNFGTIFLPQVNQKGIVMFFTKSLNKGMWFGSFYQTFLNKNKDLDYVDIPSDDPEKLHGVTSDGVNLKDDDKDKNFIARFKTTKGADNANWEEQKTSNIISIGDNELYVTHFSKDNGWEKELVPKEFINFFIGKDKETEKEIAYLKKENKDLKKTQKIAITYTEENKEGFIAEINNEKDKKNGKLILTEDGFQIIISEGGNKTREITLNKDNGIEIIVDDDKKISLDKDGNFLFDVKEMDITTDGIVINDGENYAVLYNELKKIIEKLEKHIHVAPTGITTGPLETTMAPLSPGIMSDKQKMKSKSIKTT